ncbi:hypothetical protein OSTOST_21906, partial [Ostertagia ostertagi]
MKDGALGIRGLEIVKGRLERERNRLAGLPAEVGLFCGQTCKELWIAGLENEAGLNPKSYPV